MPTRERKPRGRDGKWQECKKRNNEQNKCTYAEERIEAMLVVETFLRRLGKIALESNLDGRQRNEACGHEEDAEDEKTIT